MESMASPERTYKKEERPLDCGVVEAKADGYSKDGVGLLFGSEPSGKQT